MARPAARSVSLFGVRRLGGGSGESRKNRVARSSPSNRNWMAVKWVAFHQTISGLPSARHSESVQAGGMTSSCSALSIKIRRPRTFCA